MANLFGCTACGRYLVGMSRRTTGEVEVFEDKALRQRRREEWRKTKRRLNAAIESVPRGQLLALAKREECHANGHRFHLPATGSRYPRCSR